MASATLALVSGTVLTPDAPSGQAQAIAIDGQKIVAVGSDAEIREHVSAATRVIDLKGRLALPAFGDAHIHATTGGLESLQCNLLGVRDREGCLERVAAVAATLPDDGWVLGGGWSFEAFGAAGPLAVDLDRAAGGRPVYMPNRDHHSAWVSSAVLERAGITADTPDPFDGRIERYEDGTPTGALHDGAMALAAAVAPQPTDEMIKQGFLAAQSYLHSQGITHWQDACVGTALSLGIYDPFNAYRMAAREGLMTAQVIGALWWDRTRGIEQIDELRARREQALADGFRATTVKIMVDGVCETHTAALTEPYVLPHAHDHTGNLFLDPDVMREAVAILDADGFQVHFHALGDRAVHLALDTLEALPQERWGLGRHHLAHIQLVRPEDIGRFARLGAVANFQPLWACNEPQMTEFSVPVLGPERYDWQYRIGSLLRSGAHVAFGSDWPVSTADVVQELHVAVNRTLSTAYGVPDTPETTEPFLPDEAITIREALACFSESVAYVNGLDEQIGQLTVGRRADIAVMNENLLEIPRDQIGHTAVDLTVAGGRLVYGDE
jgi:predicted amidohydrolase YtcJ